MLDLSTLSKIKNDIESNHLTAYPFIIIHTETPLYISTIKEVIDTTPYEDYNLKISNIKESLNVKDHKFKISNVSITLNNYKNNNERLSDRIENPVNKEITVYYKTQSCDTLDECLLLYKGVIKRYDHDSSEIKITLEDLTDSTFHKDVPTANLGTRKECFSKEYFNKYIPITYGEVDKAPAIPYVDNVGLSGEYYISIIADDIDAVTMSGRGIATYDFGTTEEVSENRILPTNRANGIEINHPFYIYKDNYFKVLQDCETDFHDTGAPTAIYNDPEQYRIDDSRSFLTIRKLYASGYFQNPPANNELQAYKVHHPNQAEVVFTDLELNPSGVAGASQSRIINQDATIFRPEASFDTPEKPSLFFDNEMSGEFGTYSEIPYNQIILAGEEDLIIESYAINNFEPWIDLDTFKGWWYPNEDYGNQFEMYTTGYLYWISAWLKTNAYLLNQVDNFEAVKFVCLPHIGQIKEKLVTYMKQTQNGLVANEGDDIFDASYDIRVVPQYQLDDDFRDAWCEASGLQGDETEDMTNFLYSSNNYISAQDFIGDNLAPYYGYSNDWIGTGNNSGDQPYRIRQTNEDFSMIGSSEAIFDYGVKKKIYHPPYWSFNTYGSYTSGWHDYQNPHIYLNEFDEAGMLADKNLTVGSETSAPTGESGPNGGESGYPMGEVTYHYFPKVTKNNSTSNYWNLSPKVVNFTVRNYQNVSFSSEWYTSTGSTLSNVVTLKSILSGKKGISPAYYPTTVIKFRLLYGETDPNNLNINDYTHIYVGQWINETMGSYANNGSDLEGDWRELWINLWFDPDNDDIPYLFSSFDDFAQYTPKTLISKQWGDSDQLTMASKFDCDWNGITKNDTYSIGGGGVQQDDIVASVDYAKGAYGKFNTSDAKVHEDQIFAKTDADKEGASWFIYIEDTIGADKTMTRLSDDTTNLNEWTNDDIDPNSTETGQAKGTIIPKGCLIPFSHRSISQANNLWTNAGAGLNEGNAVVFGENKESITLQAGDTENAERRLNLLFPFSSLGNSDVLPGETNMYIYGKIKLFVDADPVDDQETNIMTSSDNLVVQILPASGEAEGDIDFNSIDLGNSIDLININGNDSEIFENSNIQEINWETTSEENQEGTETNQNKYLSLDDYYMSEWIEPNEFNALSLVYRAVGNYGATAQISTNVHSIGVIQFSIFEKALESDLYVDVVGRANNASDVFTDESGYEYKYTGESYNPSSAIISSPAGIIYHFIEKEIGQIDVVNRSSFKEALNSSVVKNMGFSVTEKINSKKLIENVCKSTNIYPRYSNDGLFNFKTIKETYSTSDITINQKDIISFNFTRTPIEDVVTMVNVKYKKDYALNEYSRVTGYCDAHDFFGNGDNGAECIKATEEVVNGYDYTSLGLTRKSNILEFESDFIRKYSEAEKLRNFLLMQNCNQHTIIKCTIPLKYINLEVGDVVDFDKLNNNTKAYGEDYTKENTRNNQIIYPYFIVTSISKSSKNIKIECFQLHKLQPTFNPGLGSLSRKSELGIMGVDIVNTESENELLGYEVLGNFNPNGHFTLEDVSYFEQIVTPELIEGGIDVNYMTSYQKRNANLNNDDSIDQYDLNEIITLFSIIGNPGNDYEGGGFSSDTGDDGTTDSQDVTFGDINNDGVVNVVDIVAMVAYILGNSQWSSDSVEFLASDLNEDGIVNVVDIVAVVADILGN